MKENEIQTFLEKQREIMSKMLHSGYDEEKNEWLESIGIIKRGAHHGLILQRDERLIEKESVHKDKPWFLQRLLRNNKNKDELSR